jgi:RNA polymerase sigma factor (sigma-70 family)
MRTATVTVFGTDYLWVEGEGLAPEAVLELEGWIKTVALRFVGKAEKLHMDLDDLQQAGMVGALQAAKTFDPRHETQFISWAKWRIYREIGRVVKPPILDSLDAIDYEACDGEMPASIVEATGDTAKCLALVSKRDSQLLKQRFGIGCKQKTTCALAKEQRVTEGAMVARMNRAYSKIRRRVYG